MSAPESDISPYELLGVTLESTEADIKKAYRQRSLKVHPDRNPNNPDAARKFHELNQAHELLLDPLRRFALDATLRVKEARKARFATFDAKRKDLQEELEEREKAFKRRKTDSEKEERVRQQETEQIKNEGRRMREEREKELLKRQAEMESTESGQEKEQDANVAPPIGSLDTTVRLKYSLSGHPTLTTPSAISSLLLQFGATDSESIVLSMKPPKKAPNQPPKYVTALIPFKQIGNAFAAVCSSGRPERGLSGIDITWAEGKEPPILGWLKDQGKLGPSQASGASTVPPFVEARAPAKASMPPSQKLGEASNVSSFSSFPESFMPASQAPLPKLKSSDIAGLDFESLTLMRMRQAERERLEREIREAESKE